MTPWLLVFHVLGIMLWTGGLMAASLALAQHAQQTNAEARAAFAALEKKFLRAVADPGAALAILAGGALISTNSSYYLSARWLYGKLFFVLLLIGLHGLLGVRAKRYAAGSIEVTRREAMLFFAAVALLLALILTATLPGSVYLT